MEEIWKDAPDYEDYLLVSNKGRIIKKHREWITGNHNSTRRLPTRIINTRLNLGYPVFDIKINGEDKILLVHILVAKAFIANPENKPYVNHLDFNRSNNNVENLEWVTAKENVVHARANKKFKHRIVGRSFGENIHTSKITEKEVREIRASCTITNKELAVIYNLDSSTISRIRSKQYWKHVI